MSSETSAIRTQTPGNYPKRNNLHLEHGESLRTRSNILLLFEDQILAERSGELSKELASAHLVSTLFAFYEIK